MDGFDDQSGRGQMNAPRSVHMHCLKSASHQTRFRQHHLAPGMTRIQTFSVAESRRSTRAVYSQISSMVCDALLEHGATAVNGKLFQSLRRQRSNGRGRFRSARWPRVDSQAEAAERCCETELGIVYKLRDFFSGYDALKLVFCVVYGGLFWKTGWSSFCGLAYNVTVFGTRFVPGTTLKPASCKLLFENLWFSLDLLDVFAVYSIRQRCGVGHPEYCTVPSSAPVPERGKTG